MIGTLIAKDDKLGVVVEWSDEIDGQFVFIELLEGGPWRWCPVPSPRLAVLSEICRERLVPWMQ